MNKFTVVALSVLVVLLSIYAIQQHQQLSAAAQTHSIDMTYDAGLKSEIQSLEQANAKLKDTIEAGKREDASSTLEEFETEQTSPTYSDSLISVESITIKPYYSGSVLVATVYNKSPYALNTTIIDVNCYDKRGVQIDNATFVFNDLGPNIRAVKNMTGTLSTKPARVQIVHVSHD